MLSSLENYLARLSITLTDNAVQVYFSIMYQEMRNIPIKSSKSSKSSATTKLTLNKISLQVQLDILGSIIEITDWAKKKRPDCNLAFPNSAIEKVQNAQTAVWQLQNEPTPKSALNHRGKWRKIEIALTAMWLNKIRMPLRDVVK